MTDFVGKSKNDFTTWANGFSNMVDSRSLYEESDEEPGTILKQSIPKGTTVKEIIEGSKTIEITYAKAKENNPGGNDNPGGDNPGGENPGGDNPGGGENPGGDNPGGDNPGGGTGGGNEPDPTPEDPNNG